MAASARPVGAAIAPGASWASLASEYRVPDWFRDAKFGMWAHWGPQCQPEAGDWYGRLMYVQGQPAYAHHLEHYGHPSRTGFIDIIGKWKAEHWDPAYLLDRYRKAGRPLFHGDGLPPRQSRPLRQPAPCVELAAGRTEARHRRHLGETGPADRPQVRRLQSFEPCLALVADGLWLRCRRTDAGPAI